MIIRELSTILEKAVVKCINELREDIVKLREEMVSDM
jgi:hypothetical protein